tara:strand:- start:933 stop:2369 length:1437 start_codon:yes stop_codon:yes gene_type:complete
MFFPLGPFEPDRSRHSNSAVQVATNVRPTIDGWGPLPALVGISDPLPSAPKGSVAVKTTNGTWDVYAGTVANLYKLAPDNSWTEISRVTDDYSLDASSGWWDFQLFGSNLVATALGSTYPQVLDIDTSGDFANLANATFEAENVFTAGDFLVFARVGGNNKKLKWSGVNNIEFWTPAQRGSGEQIFPSGGPIQAGLEQVGGSVIFQESEIRMMTFSPGSGLAFNFAPLDLARGAFARRAIVPVGANDVIYLAKDGFYRNGTPIGAERIDKFFFGIVDKADLAIGAADPYEKIAWFKFTDSASVNYLLGYDWQLDRWLYSDQEVTDFLASATAGYSLEQLSAFGTLDTLPYSLDSRFWKGALPLFAGFNNAFEYGFFDGTNLEAVIETDDKMLIPGRRALTDTAIILGDTNSAQVRYGVREKPGDNLSFTAYASQESDNRMIPLQVGGAQHRVGVKIPAAATWSELTAIDVRFTDDGEF